MTRLGPSASISLIAGPLRERSGHLVERQQFRVNEIAAADQLRRRLARPGEALLVDGDAVIPRADMNAGRVQVGHYGGDDVADGEGAIPARVPEAFDGVLLVADVAAGVSGGLAGVHPPRPPLPPPGWGRPPAPVRRGADRSAGLFE